MPGICFFTTGAHALTDLAQAVFAVERFPRLSLFGFIRALDETRRGAVRDHVALAGPPSLRALPSAHDP